VIQLNRKIRTVGHVLGELRLGTLLQRWVLAPLTVLQAKLTGFRDQVYVVCGSRVLASSLPLELAPIHLPWDVCGRLPGGDPKKNKKHLTREEWAEQNGLDPSACEARLFTPDTVPPPVQSSIQRLIDDSLAKTSDPLITHTLLEYCLEIFIAHQNTVYTAYLDFLVQDDRTTLRWKTLHSAFYDWLQNLGLGLPQKTPDGRRVRNDRTPMFEDHQEEP
jgi:hypothetical protein